MPRPANKRKTKPTVSIVGSGRLGTALARALFLSGYRIESVIARHSARARKAAALVGRATQALAANQLSLLPPSKIILIATPDDEIALTAQKLAALHEGSARGRTVLHTSGALSSDVLAPLAGRGFHVGSLHPLVSVSDPQSGYANLRGAFYCLEGDTAAAAVARNIVRDLKGQSFYIHSQNKPLYHAAAVMASGHVVALFELATEMLRECGLTPKNARLVLLPLLKSTLTNLSAAEPARALTGTFARGDLATVQRHLHALSNHKLADALAAYKLLGRRSLELAKSNAVEPLVLMKIRQALDSEGKNDSGTSKE